jgi:hypothetical protein
MAAYVKAVDTLAFGGEWTAVCQRLRRRVDEKEWQVELKPQVTRLLAAFKASLPRAWEALLRTGDSARDNNPGLIVDEAWYMKKICQELPFAQICEDTVEDTPSGWVTAGETCANAIRWVRSTRLFGVVRTAVLPWAGIELGSGEANWRDVASTIGVLVTLGLPTLERLVGGAGPGIAAALWPGASSVQVTDESTWRPDRNGLARLIIKLKVTVFYRSAYARVIPQIPVSVVPAAPALLSQRRTSIVRAAPSQLSSISAATRRSSVVRGGVPPAYFQSGYVPTAPPMMGRYRHRPRHYDMYGY